MMNDLSKWAVHGRDAKQERSERTRRAIVQAVIELLAERGVAGLTHRLVAERSGASLAATTYYFAAKPDLIAEASNELIRVYLGDFSRSAARASGGGAAAFRRFVARRAADAMCSYRTMTLAWCELMLEGARHAEGRTLARAWFKRMTEVWEQAARGFGLPEAEIAARSAMDMTIGALFHGLAAGLEAEPMAATLTSAVDVSALFPPTNAAAGLLAPRQRVSAKAAATRERILDAAIGLLAARGAGAVNYRSVALEAGLTAGAPAYHFPSSDALLAQAQALLFARSKARSMARYRETMADAAEGLDLATMVELTAVIFQSETTEFADLNVAIYAIWLQAARQPELRSLVHEAIIDLHRAWSSVLTMLRAEIRGPEPLLVQYLIVGSLVRVICCGATPVDLVAIRAQLKEQLSAIAEGRHWIQS